MLTAQGDLLVNFFYWILEKGFRLARFLLHLFLTLIYQGRGKHVSPTRNELVLISATKLAQKIREGKIKCEDVIQAYIDRILEVEPVINATVQRRFSDALKEARDVDVLVASGKFTKEQLAEQKPLLGVPLSVKVFLTVKGLRSTASSKLFKDVKATEDAPTVAAMKSAGAIILATTNTPEMGLNLESNNKLYGRTYNPYDTSRTSGGSSGGESALISAGGSVIGLGNDLIGSIRIPSLFTGLFGHKPSRGMVSSEGCFPVPNSKVLNLLSTGPICRYAEDLVTTMSVLTARKEMRIKFGQSVNFADVKIFYMLSMDVPFAAPVQKDFQEAIKKVICYFQNTYQVIAKEKNIPLLKKSNLIAFHFLLSAAGNITHTLTSGKKNVNRVREFLKWLIGISDLTVPAVLTMNFGKSPLFYNKTNLVYYENLAKQLDEEFDTFLDEKSVFLFPTFPITAPYNNEALLYIPSSCYCNIFNTLGLPSTQCPLGLNNQGLPIGIQIISRRNNDPLTIALAVELEKAFGGWVMPGTIER
ncbi:Fatty-acid amide hydrolase 2, partial [Stegodyphus mimosarum]